MSGTKHSGETIERELSSQLAEARSAWSAMPSWLKFWSVISIPLTFSAIASISETVLKWRGFLADAVDTFDRIVGPLERLIESIIPLQVVDESVELLTLYYVLIGVAARAGWHPHGTEQPKPEGRVKRAAQRGIMVWGLFAILIMPLGGLFHPWLLLLPYLAAFMIFAGCAGAILSDEVNKDWSKDLADGSTARGRALLIVLYVLLIAILFGIAAAISAGLTAEVT